MVHQLQAASFDTRRSQRQAEPLPGTTVQPNRGRAAAAFPLRAFPLRANRPDRRREPRADAGTPAGARCAAELRRAGQPANGNRVLRRLSAAPPLPSPPPPDRTLVRWGHAPEDDLRRTDQWSPGVGGRGDRNGLAPLLSPSSERERLLEHGGRVFTAAGHRGRMPARTRGVDRGSPPPSPSPP